MIWEWSDLRYFLAVARSGSTSSAARILGVNQTTCARRIDALERGLGLALFDRTAAGYRITEAGAALVREAELTEIGALAFEKLAGDRARAARKIVRLSAGDFLAELIALPAIAALAAARPELRIELDVRSDAIDLSAGGTADVALRAALRIAEPQLIARKLFDTPWAFYCSRRYAGHHGPPPDLPAAMTHPLVILAGTPLELLAARFPGVNPRHVTNSMTALSAAVVAGRGVGALPMLVGDRQAELVRCFPLAFDTGGVWIVYHERLRRAPQVRLLVDQLALTARDAIS